MFDYIIDPRKERVPPALALLLAFVLTPLAYAQGFPSETEQPLAPALKPIEHLPPAHKETKDHSKRLESDPIPDGPHRLVLKGGSQMSGELSKLADGDFYFDDDTLGEIEVDAADVHRLGFGLENEVFYQQQKRDEISSGTLLPDGTLKRDGYADVLLWDAKVHRLEFEHYSLWDFSGNFAANFTYTDGNTRTLGYGSTLALGLKHPMHIFEFTASAYYAEQDRIRSAQRAKASLGYTWHFSDSFGTFVRETLIHDDFKDLRLRSESSAGMTLFLYDDDDFNWRWDLGISYIDENFDQAEDRDYWAGQLSMALEYRLNTRVWAEANSRSTANVELSNTKNFDVSSQASLYLKVYDNITVSFTIQHDYDAQPPADTKRNDYRVILSVGVTF